MQKIRVDFVPFEFIWTKTETYDENGQNLFIKDEIDKFNKYREDGIYPVVKIYNMSS